jgi:hypothetical protein
MRRSLNLSLSYFVGVWVTCMVGGGSAASEFSPEQYERKGEI